MQMTSQPMPEDEVGVAVVEDKDEVVEFGFVTAMAAVVFMSRRYMAV